MREAINQFTVLSQTRGWQLAFQENTLKTRIHCILSSLAMVNKSGARVPMPERRQKRRQRQRAAISDQNNIRYRDLDKRSANRDSKENSCEEVEPNKYAASIVKQKELEEIVSLLATTLGCRLL